MDTTLQTHRCGLVVMTGDRKPNVLRRLVAQLEQAGVPYVVSHGTIRRTNLKDSGITRGTILTLPNLEQIQALSKNQQDTLNYIHSLQVGASFGAPFIVLDDRVTLSKHFSAFLSHVFSQLGGTNAVVSLYVVPPSPHAVDVRALSLVPIEPDEFRVRAVVYPDYKVAFDLARRLEDVVHQDTPLDLAVAAACKEIGVSLFMTSFSLVSDGHELLFIDNYYTQPTD